MSSKSSYIDDLSRGNGRPRALCVRDDILSHSYHMGLNYCSLCHLANLPSSWFIGPYALRGVYTMFLEYSKSALIYLRCSGPLPKSRFLLKLLAIWYWLISSKTTWWCARAIDVASHCICMTLDQGLPLCRRCSGRYISGLATGLCWWVLHKRQLVFAYSVRNHRLHTRLEVPLRRHIC